MLERLFGSRTRVKLLRFLFTQPEKPYYIRELVRSIGEQINSVRRELNNLEDLGIVKSQSRDKKKYYVLDSQFILFPELQSLIVKSRLMLDKQCIQALKHVGTIEYFALTGFFVNDQQAQVDVFMIGTVNRKKMEAFIDQLSTSFSTQIRFTVMTQEEYRYRKDVADKFLYQIIDGKKIVVTDHLES